MKHTAESKTDLTYHFERYFYSQVGAQAFNVCDLTTSGLGTARHPIAVCFDSEVAERLVRLLNKDDWYIFLEKEIVSFVHAARRPVAQEDGLDT